MKFRVKIETEDRIELLAFTVPHEVAGRFLTSMGELLVGLEPLVRLVRPVPPMPSAHIPGEAFREVRDIFEEMGRIVDRYRKEMGKGKGTI